MTTTFTDCQIQGGKNVCPAQSNISFAGVTTTVRAELSCPLDAAQQSDFIEASQEGMCQCNTAILGDQPNDPSIAVPCDCYACPLGSRLGFAIWCQEPLIGFCHNFTCGGQCDGDIAVIGPQKTMSPTQAPTKPGGMASGGNRSFGDGMTDGMVLPAMMIGYYLLFKMMMH